MTRATLWWVRHGPTHARTMIGWTDAAADLSDVAAIERLAGYLPERAPVVSSDLARARDTAAALAGRRMRLPDDRNLREINFGAWEARSPADIRAADPDLITAFWDDPGSVAAPGGECWHALSERVCRAADDLAQRGGDVIVVAHFGAILTQLERAFGLSTRDTFGHRIDNLSVTRLSFDGAGWTAHEINHCP